MATTRPANDGNLWTTVELRKLDRLAKDPNCLVERGERADSYLPRAASKE